MFSAIKCSEWTGNWKPVGVVETLHLTLIDHSQGARLHSLQDNVWSAHICCVSVYFNKTSMGSFEITQASLIPIFNPHLLSTSIHPTNIICWFAVTHIHPETHAHAAKVCKCWSLSTHTHASVRTHRWEVLSRRGMQSGIITASSALSSERAGQ